MVPTDYGIYFSIITSSIFAFNTSSTVSSSSMPCLLPRHLVRKLLEDAGALPGASSDEPRVDHYEEVNELTVSGVVLSTSLRKRKMVNAIKAL